MTHIYIENFLKVHVLKCWMASLGKLQFLIKKFFFFSCNFFLFLVIKALYPDWIRIRIGIQPQTLDPDPDQINTDPDQMNTDPKPCIIFDYFFLTKIFPPIFGHQKSGSRSARIRIHHQRRL